jgi:probable addiction module antidote protein
VVVINQVKKEISKKLKITLKYGRKTTMGKYKNSTSFDDFMIRNLKDEEVAKEFLNASLENYVQEGHFDEFLSSLELVIKTRQSVSSFAQETKLNRANLYSIFRSKKKPQFDTVLKILAQLGFSIKVA